MELSLPPKQVLYLFACASPSTQNLQDFIVLAQEKAWDVCVFTTPNALNFINVPLIEALTKHPVRSEYKIPGTEDVFPKGDVTVVAPATFNTVSKLALGIADNLALSQMCKAMGLKQPFVIAPCIPNHYANHPAFKKNLNVLKKAGIKVLHDPKHYPAPMIVPWGKILDAIEVNNKRHIT